MALQAFPIEGTPFWYIACRGFSQTLRVTAKSTPGMKWQPAQRYWYGYEDAVAVTLQRCRDAGLIVDKGHTPTSLKEFATPLPVADAGMYDYQKVGVRFVLANAKNGALLADDMGLGKTLQSIRAARACDQRTLIVCPSFVRGVWQQELTKWWPVGAKAAAFPEGVKERDAGILAGKKVVVLHYDILHAWADDLLAWGPQFLVFDEVHYLQSQKSRRSLVARKLAEATARKVGLSGTPMTNRPRDLFNVIDTLSPGRVGTFFDFGLRYCAAHQEEVTRDKVVWIFDGVSAPEELQERMKFFMLRRTKQDVRLQLPDKTRQIVEVTVKARARIAPTATMLGNRSQLRRTLDAIADGKLPEVMELVASHIVEGQSVVVATHRRVIAEAFVNEMVSQGFTANLIHGGVPIEKRQAIIDSHPQVLAATIDSCGVGIDLTYANVMVVAELSYEPHKLLQLEARLNRHGQKRPVLIQYAIGIGTTDELIADVVIRKLGNFKTIIGDVGTLGEDLMGGAGGDPLKALSDALLKNYAKEQKQAAG